MRPSTVLESTVAPSKQSIAPLYFVINSSKHRLLTLDRCSEHAAQGDLFRNSSPLTTMTKSKEEVEQRLSAFNLLKEKLKNNVKLSDDEKRELKGLRSFFRNQTKVKDANGNEITINQRNSRALVKDADGNEMTMNQRNNNAIVKDENGKETTRNQFYNNAIVKDENGKETTRYQRNNYAIVKDENGKETTRYQHNNNAIVKDENGKETTRNQFYNNARAEERRQIQYERALALKVLESSEDFTKENITESVRNLVEREIDKFQHRPEVTFALDSGNYVLHTAVMHEGRDGEEWYNNFFKCAALPADGKAWSTKSNKKLKKSMKEKPLLLRIAVGNTPFHGNLGEEGAIDYIHNVKKLPISNDTVSASNGKSKGGASPMYQYPGGECYGYRSERQEDRNKRYERASDRRALV